MIASQGEDARRAESRQAQRHDGRKPSGTNAIRCVADSSCHCTSGDGQESSDLEKARLWAARGDAWRKDAPEAWAAFERIAASCVADKRPFSSDLLSAHLKKTRGYVFHSTGMDVSIDNTLWPYFARVLLSEHPELRPYARPRKSFFDVLFGGGARG